MKCSPKRVFAVTEWEHRDGTVERMKLGCDYDRATKKVTNVFPDQFP
jgi:hypothetical protein